jgi:4-hydroxy-tetrahydrodipicolinate synthase
MCGEDWVMLSGNDDTALGYMAHGGHGCISVTCNVAPEPARRFINDACRPVAGRALRPGPADPPAQGAVPDASPAPTKFALAHLGLCSRGRPPADRALLRGRAPREVLAAMREAG